MLKVDKQPTVMRKLIQAYTDRSGQVVVGQLLSRLFRKQTASISLRLVPSYHAGLRLKMLEELTDTRTRYFVSGVWYRRFSARNPLHLYLPIWGSLADSRSSIGRSQ